MLPVLPLVREVISHEAPPNTGDEVVMAEVHTLATEEPEVPIEVHATVTTTQEVDTLATSVEGAAIHSSFLQQQPQGLPILQRLQLCLWCRPS